MKFHDERSLVCPYFFIFSTPNSKLNYRILFVNNLSDRDGTDWELEADYRSACLNRAISSGPPKAFMGIMTSIILCLKRR